MRLGAVAMSLALLVVDAPALAQPLPQPLALTDAMRLAADESHYEMQFRKADLDAARAGLLGVQGDNDLKIAFEARARYIDPASLSADQSRNDSAALLVARKRLYDFGRSSALEHAALAMIESEETRFAMAAQQRRLDAMRAFYEVLLADLGYTLANERMAIVYVDYDKIKQRRELGQLSQVDLLRAQTGYEEALRERSVAEARQRSTRVKLASALGDATQLPAKLVEPELKLLESRAAPPIDTQIKLALEQNPSLKALRHQLQAANERIEATRAKYMPVVDAVIEAGEYNRPVGGNDPFRAGLVLTAPLVMGRSHDADLLRAEAEKSKLSALLQRSEAELRQRMTELILDIDVLRKGMSGDRVRNDYRDVYMERSRVLYEMEVSTDLGDSMVQMTDARLRSTRTLYALSLAWAELELLSGQAVSLPDRPSSPTQGKAP